MALELTLVGMVVIYSVLTMTVSPPSDVLVDHMVVWWLDEVVVDSGDDDILDSGSSVDEGCSELSSFSVLEEESESSFELEADDESGPKRMNQKSNQMN